jgi:menaquinol-cytochrome c reductase cytochrome b/c subunit
MAVEAERPAAPARPRPKREREEEVLVWPDLVFVEFIASILFTITFMMLSVFINAPLLNRANPEVTPNPSKAPWYFLNLQELLLHMDKAWAGVLLPTIALVFFAVIPYIDRSREAQGIWFGTKRAVRLTVVSLVYALVVSVALVVFDAGETNVFPSQLVPGEGPDFRSEQLTRWIPSCDGDAAHQGFPCLTDEEGAAHQGILSTKDIAKRLQFSFPVPEWFGAPTSDGKMDWPGDLDHIPVPFNGVTCDLSYGSLHLWCDMHLNIATIMAEQVIPLSVIVFFAVAIIYVLFRVGWLRTNRDLFIVMFTAVMMSYLTLSMVGSFFRGPGQALIGPWDIKVDEG